VKCDIGRTEARRWTVTPTDRDVGEHAMTVTVKDDAGNVLQQAKTVLAVASRSAGADRSQRLHTDRSELLLMDQVMAGEKQMNATIT